MIDKSVQVIEPEAQKALYSAESLIQQAIDKGVPIETMERLLVMRRELKAEFAKQMFDAAMAKFQSECPVIEKKKAVIEKDGKTVRYKYAPLDSIVEQVKKALADNGLSYTFGEYKEEKFTTIICYVTHVAGHTQKTTFKIPIGTEAYMSDVQKYGARMTFGKRYAFCNAFGIMTGDEDTDANETQEVKKQSLENKKIDQKPASTVKPNMTNGNDGLKVIIKKFCDELSPAKLSTAIEYRNFVKHSTELELTENNYEEIVERLKIIKEEREGA